MSLKCLTKHEKWIFVLYIIGFPICSFLLGDVFKDSEYYHAYLTAFYLLIIASFIQLVIEELKRSDF